MTVNNKTGLRWRAGRSGKQDGYAIMMVAFLTTIMLVAAIVAMPSVRTERRREQEEEMIWRGKQYVHAIKLYYRKNGRFPTNIDDLTKPKNGSTSVNSIAEVTPKLPSTPALFHTVT